MTGQGQHRWATQPSFHKASQMNLEWSRPLPGQDQFRYEQPKSPAKAAVPSRIFVDTNGSERRALREHRTLTATTESAKESPLDKEKLLGRSRLSKSSETQGEMKSDKSSACASNATGSGGGQSSSPVPSMQSSQVLTAALPSMQAAPALCEPIFKANSNAETGQRCFWRIGAEDAPILKPSPDQIREPQEQAVELEHTAEPVEEEHSPLCPSPQPRPPRANSNSRAPAPRILRYLQGPQGSAADSPEAPLAFQQIGQRTAFKVCEPQMPRLPLIDIRALQKPHGAKTYEPEVEPPLMWSQPNTAFSDQISLSHKPGQLESPETFRSPHGSSTWQQTKPQGVEMSCNWFSNEQCEQGPISYIDLSNKNSNCVRMWRDYNQPDCISKDEPGEWTMITVDLVAGNCCVPLWKSQSSNPDKSLPGVPDLPKTPEPQYGGW